jgi:sterol desaturase/sphingolipid hydroxylase (fatty acid hydroxylase superfamily)
MHHAHAYDNKMNEHILVPWWGQIIMTSVILSTALLMGVWFAVGVMSFSALYMHRHWTIHNKDTTSRASVHHRIHHLRHPFSNYSGMYPFIDDIFGTTIDEE